MAKNHLRVSFLGSSFTIQSDNDPEYLDEVVEYLRHKIGEAARAAAPGDPLKTALIVALNLVDELFKERQKKIKEETKDSREIEIITEQLIDKIERSLSE